MAHYRTKILLANDALTMRKIIADMLSGLGYQKVIEAASKQDALLKVEREEFGLVISDWKSLTRLELVKSPLLIVTTENEKYLLTPPLDHRVIHYVVKPFSKEGLRQKILKIA